jgi:aldehyde:ferredoxin oxidoreductase
MSSYGGYYGKLLRINLGDGGTKEDTLPKEDMERYLGGRGVASKILMDELAAGVDPLGSGNKLIFITGPLTGTVVPTTSRLCISAKSPLTGLPGSGFCGGSLGPELKFCGYDGLILEGRADRPVYVIVDDGTVEIRDAGALWGKDSFETETIIRRELGNMPVEVACIGQAGEKLVRFACIVHDAHFVVGRRGMGAVMGSKNLKAVAFRRRSRHTTRCSISWIKTLWSQCSTTMERPHPSVS